MHNIKLIALDLDGTLLNSQKELPPQNYKALMRAAQAGIHIVPTTGRFYAAMPQVIRELPFVRYVIALNGAQVLDTRTSEVLYRAEMDWQDVVRIMEYLDGYDVIYDCFMDDTAWMTRSMWERSAEYAINVHYRTLMRELRRPVDDLKSFLRQRGQSVQKAQAVFRDMGLRSRMIREIPQLFAPCLVTSSVDNNIEINHPDANKGEAMARLCAYLGLHTGECAAFGDGLNDVSMLKRAGIGVVMAQSCPEAASAADMTAPSCDDCGVAQVLEKLLL